MNQSETSRTESPSLRHLFTDRRIAVMLALGFSSGLPLLLVFGTQQAWLSDAKIPLETVGVLAELTIAYKLKFLWAPFLDRYDMPVLGRLLGRRRGWILTSQIAVVLALTGVAFGDPAHNLAWTVLFCLTLGFAGATQDVVIDGWRITVSPAERQALMSSWAEIGWRLGNLAAGAGALLLADRFGWRAAYLCMAALMAPGMIAALLAPEPQVSIEHKHARQSFRETIAAPIRDLAGRLGPLAIPVLLMVAGFRMPGYVSGAMEIPLFKSLDYSNTDIGTVTKVFGFGVGLAGTFAAGWLVPRLGIMRSLIVGTVFGSASHLTLAYLAVHGEHGQGGFATFAAAVSIDNFAYAFASVVLIIYMSSLVSTTFAASQFALLTSVCALPGSLLAGTSGYISKAVGFEWFFVGTALLGVPVAVLCWWVGRRQQAVSQPTGQQETGPQAA